jgi:hypothetical protein
MMEEQITYKVDPSYYKTWMVYQYNGAARGLKVYETTNKVKAQGVQEYLTEKEAK